MSREFQQVFAFDVVVCFYICSALHVFIFIGIELQHLARLVDGAFPVGSVSGSGTGPGDPGSRGPALPDPETFPYEWLGVRQYISMSCVSCL